MPKIEIHENFQIIRQNDYLQVIQLENKLVVYKLLKKFTLEKKKGRPKLKVGEPVTLQGIVPAKTLKDYLSGKHGLGMSNFDLISSEVLEGLRKRGWSYGQEERLAWVLEKPFDIISSGGDCHVVKFLHDCHMLEDSAGQKLPVGVYFDYIAARMDHNTYDLEKAVAILDENPDIEFLLDDAPYNEDPRILRIPSYNGGGYHLSFWWAPSVDEYRRLWNKCVSLGGSYPSTNKERAVWELDLLGLRKGGAAKYDDFYGGPDDDDEEEEEDDY